MKIKVFRITNAHDAIKYSLAQDKGPKYILLDLSTRDCESVIFEASEVSKVKLKFEKILILNLNFS